MAFLKCLLLLVLAGSAWGTAAAAGVGCGELKLVPAVRECSAVERVRLGAAGIAVRAGGDAEDRFAAEDLEAALRGRGFAVSAGGVEVAILHADTAEAEGLLKAAGLRLDAAQEAEWYALVPRKGGGLAVIGATAAGRFYGVQTVKQLVRGGGGDAVLLTPTVRDWPAMAHRGLSEDWSRGPVPTMEFLKREIRTLAAYKQNLYSPYFEHTFAYRSTRVAAFPDAAMTPAEARELVAYAARYHVTVIPEQEAFGHLHNVLKYELYAHLGETEHGAVLAPGDAGTLPQIGEWFGELAEVFPGPYAHIGADETFELGLGRTRGAVEKDGLDAVYIDFLKRIHEELAPLGKKLLFWGDIAVNSPERVKTLPKDMIAVSWDYAVKTDYAAEIEPFVKAGLETWVAPGAENSGRVFPDNNAGLANIRVFVRDGQRLGATGMLNTLWNDDADEIFDQSWLCVLFGAAASWQAGDSDAESFVRAYGLAFHGDATGKISAAEEELMAGHAALSRAGLDGALNAQFWMDPFTAKGRAVGAKLLPAAHELRMHAERALALMGEARDAAAAEGRPLENEEALAAMELGARRMDFIGLKFQAADESAKAWAEAKRLAATGDAKKSSEVATLLEQVASTNGHIEDIREGYVVLEPLYREAWLRDYRPYWLGVNETRFRSAAELWNGRSVEWQQVLEGWWEEQKLTPPADEGMLTGK